MYNFIYINVDAWECVMSIGAEDSKEHAIAMHIFVGCKGSATVIFLNFKLLSSFNKIQVLSCQTYIIDMFNIYVNI